MPIRSALAALLLAASAGCLWADEASRIPTAEERRFMDLQLQAAGFEPCTTVTLVDSRWSCRSTDAAGQSYVLSLSNLDFAVIARQRVE